MATAPIWKVGFLSEAVKCSGQTRYKAKGDRTECHISGELEVDASESPCRPKDSLHVSAVSRIEL